MPALSADLYHVEQAPLKLRPDKAARNIASDPNRQHLLDRMEIRELCEGWPVYRDAAEWENYRSMFHPGAYITTSWEQGTIEQFVAASKAAFAEQKEGMFHILHRVTGQTVDVQGDRAVSKLKVTITCRVTIDGKEMDNEADCRFFALLERRQGVWGVALFTLLFDKDKMIVVNPTVGGFDIPESEVEKYPRQVDAYSIPPSCFKVIYISQLLTFPTQTNSGYRYLCWCEDKVGHPPKLDLNAHGPERDILYQKCKDWLEGKEVKPNLTGNDIIDY